VSRTYGQRFLIKVPPSSYLTFATADETTVSTTEKRRVETTKQTPRIRWSNAVIRRQKTPRRLRNRIRLQPGTCYRTRKYETVLPSSLTFRSRPESVKRLGAFSNVDVPTTTSVSSSLCTRWSATETFRHFRSNRRVVVWRRSIFTDNFRSARSMEGIVVVVVVVGESLLRSGWKYFLSGARNNASTLNLPFVWTRERTRPGNIIKHVRYEFREINNGGVGIELRHVTIAETV